MKTPISYFSVTRYNLFLVILKHRKLHYTFFSGGIRSKGLVEKVRVRLNLVAIIDETDVRF